MLVLGLKIGDVVEIRHGAEVLKVRFLEDRRGRTNRIGFDGPVRFEVTRLKAQKGSRHEVQHGAGGEVRDGDQGAGGRFAVDQPAQQESTLGDGAAL